MNSVLAFLLWCCLIVGDSLFGWLLAWSPEAVVVLLAVISAGLLLLARYLSTDQNRLANLQRDMKRTRELLRNAKTSNEIAEVARLKKLRNHFSLLKLAEEWRPLLISIAPLAVLGVWASERLVVREPLVGDSLEIELHAPYSAVNRIAHLEPTATAQCDAWITQIESLAAASPPVGSATWVLTLEQPPPESWVIHVADARFQHQTAIEFGESYRLIQTHANGYATEVKWPRVDFWGVIPPIPLSPAWLVIYLPLTMLATWLLKRLTGIL